MENMFISFLYDLFLGKNLILVLQCVKSIISKELSQYDFDLDNNLTLLAKFQFDFFFLEENLQVLYFKITKLCDK